MENVLLNFVYKKSEQSDTSHNFKIGAYDSRCRYWCKIVRDGTELPIPSSCEGANDIPGNYLRKGDEEIFPGDIVIEGEEVSHRRARGWDYWVHWIGSDGFMYTIKNPGADIKQALKTAGIDKYLLPGAGGVAACVRVAHALRA